MRAHVWTAAVPAVLALILCACGGEAELSPEITAHLDEYERLIEKFEPRFDAVRNDLPEFAKVAESYEQESRAWLDEWSSVAPELSDAEGRAVKASVEKLNRRALKMLTGA